MLPIEVQGMIDSFLCQKTMTQIEASGGENVSFVGYLGKKTNPKSNWWKFSSINGVLKSSNLFKGKTIPYPTKSPGNKSLNFSGFL